MAFVASRKRRNASGPLIICGFFVIASPRRPFEELDRRLQRTSRNLGRSNLRKRFVIGCVNPSEQSSPIQALSRTRRRERSSGTRNAGPAWVMNFSNRSARRSLASRRILEHIKSSATEEAVVHRFPYLIFYVIDAQEIVVLACDLDLPAPLPTFIASFPRSRGWPWLVSSTTRPGVRRGRPPIRGPRPASPSPSRSA